MVWEKWHVSLNSDEMKTPSLISALALLTSSICQAEEGWTTDFEAAQARAEKEGKDLLINFTGSDWCKWCIVLKEEVLQHDPFKKGVADKFVLVELDYPNNQEILEQPIIDQNKELQEKYAPPGFPTILLTKADGTPYAQTGYQKGGPDAYVKHLDELRAIKDALKEGFDAAGAPQDREKKNEALFTTLQKIAPNLLKHYEEKIDALQAPLEEEQAKFVESYWYNEARYALEKTINAKIEEEKFDEAIDEVDKFIAEHTEANPDQKFGFQGATHQEILAFKVNLFMAQQELVKAKEILVEIVGIDDKTELGVNSKLFIPRLEKMIEQKEAKEAPEEE